MYAGDDKLVSNANRYQLLFHAKKRYTRNKL